jgi:O-succinylbenzoic acid--CoA ligase
MRALTVPTGPEVLDVVLPALAAALDGGPPLLPLPAGPPAVVDALLAALRPDQPLEDPEVALVVPTSGSTGEPKGALLTAAAVHASARATHDRLGGPGRWLLALPPTHVAGLMVLARSLATGTEPVAVDRSGPFDPDRFATAAATLAHDTPRYVSLVPAQLRLLLDAGTDLTGFDAVLLGGAAAAPALLDRARSAGVAVVTTYGMSETCGGCVYDGVPLDGVAVALDPDGRIRLGGPTVFRGYRLRPDLTAGALDAAGRLRTGDLGRLDADGRLHVLGRADDVIVTGGVNVPAASVEAAVAAHPGVAACAVVGVPDDVWGERVAVAVQPEPGADPLDLARLRAFVADRLEPAAQPRLLVLVEAIPLLASGKPDKDAVRALVGGGDAQEVR